MNGDDPKPQSNKGVIFIVILTVSVCAVIGVCSFAYCMVFTMSPEGVIATTFGNIVIACFGYLSGVLTRTAPTEMTKHVDVSNQPTVTDSTVTEGEKK